MKHWLHVQEWQQFQDLLQSLEHSNLVVVLLELLDVCIDHNQMMRRLDHLKVAS
jgi:hypothetical protein